MGKDVAPPTCVDAFITRWAGSGSAERANYQLFLLELCNLLGVERPEPTSPDDARNTYVFEKAVTFPNSDGSKSTGRIDLYRRTHFVCETKQGYEKKKEESDPAAPKAQTRRGHGERGTRAWDAAMEAARGQAERYVRAIPDDNPPFVLVIDVGYSIEIYSDFSRLGKIYTPFPDARSHRLFLKDLGSDDLRERLKLIWTDPLALDPSRRSAKVTREIADKLARLAKSLEGEKHDPDAVAGFLMRCLFTLFAEDVHLLKDKNDQADQPFTKLLEDVQAHPDQFVPMVQDVWKAMDAGSFSPALRRQLMKFNGGLFADQTVLKLNKHQIQILHEAAKSDWKHVEPAIFGTLLERALDPTERHKLGAHYTPRAYVERLVLPTIIEPLREEWDAAKAAAITLRTQAENLQAEAEAHPVATPKDRKAAEELGKQSKAKRRDATKPLTDYLKRLCDTVVLDPACGSGNFLYVTLEHMKRLEGEVRDQLQQFGEAQTELEGMGLTVDPHQFKGIEINPRAAHIADLVLWIGYLQWHFRVYGNTPPREPVLRAFHNIENRDAVLAYNRKELVTDDAGKPVTRWDGRTMKKHPVTGEDIPDESARVQRERYVLPQSAQWPEADFVIGNPPYVGVRKMRATLGDDYVEALTAAYPAVPETCDLVMYWWHRAALAVEQKSTRQFGFITTNSIVQSYSRSLVDQHLSAKPGVVIVFAIPDHPWVEAADGAAVRVAMTVGTSSLVSRANTRLMMLANPAASIEVPPLVEYSGIQINGALKADLGETRVVSLEANRDMCFQGVVPSGDGFKLVPEDIERMKIDLKECASVLKPYIIGRDLVRRHQPKYIIDFFGLTVRESRENWPQLYQHLIDHVKGEREAKRGATKDSQEYADNWWIFAKTRPTLRAAVSGLARFIVTPYTAKYRPFMFVSGGTLPDAMAYAIPSADAWILGVLSSRVHMKWALRTGGRMGVGNDPRYTNDVTFKPFPFPDAADAQKSRIRDLGEQLDAHRKTQQAAHPGLTITDMYNVLEKLRSGETLTAKEKTIHEQGLVSVLKQIHDDLDAAVFAAYGWPKDLTDEQILEKLVALNAERAAEEKRGLIRWLRPDFQNKPGRVAQTELDLPEAEEKPAKRGKKTTAPRNPRNPKPRKAVKHPWPVTMAEQAKALRAVLASDPAARTAADIAKSFRRANPDRIAELLETLASLGQARKVDGERYSA